MKSIHWLAIVCLAGMSSSCFGTRSIPILRPAKKILVTIKGDPDLHTKDYTARANRSQFAQIYELIQPVQTMRFYQYELAAEVILKHADGTRTIVYVRDWGKNPAMVSLEYEHFYLAKVDPKVPAGAWKLLTLFHEQRSNRPAARFIGQGRYCRPAPHENAPSSRVPS